MSLTQESRYKWKDLPWQEIEGKTFKLQKRIYRASRISLPVMVQLSRQTQKVSMTTIALLRSGVSGKLSRTVLHQRQRR